MQQFCPNCQAEIAEGKKFCHNCGAKVEAAQAPARFPAPEQTESARQQFEIPPAAPPPQFSGPAAPPAAQAQPTFGPAPAQYMPTGLENEKPRKDSPYAPMGMLSYLGWLALMCIPVVGWILTVVLSFSGSKQNRKNLARAMLVLTGVGIALAATLTILYWEFIKDLKWLIEQNFEITFGF